MARLPRLYVPGLPQHALLRGNNHERVIRDDEDAKSLLDALLQASRTHGFAVHAYALMPDHLHLLGTAASPQSLPRTLQAVGRRYVASFNRKYGRTGTLWEGRYRSTVLDPDRWLLPVSFYIEANPVRAGLAATAVDWRWSSHAHHVGLAADRLVSDHSVYWGIANTPFERQARYRAGFEEGLSDTDLDAIRATTQKGWALGDSHFVNRTAPVASRRPHPARRGRPAAKSVPN